MAELITTLWRRLALDEAGTRAALTVPALVWEAPPRATTDADRWQMTLSGHGGALSRPGPGQALVYMVEKRPTEGKVSPFPMGVTVGRVDTNDVVVDDTSVSRFHAFLQHDARRGLWSLTDAESRNGTWVNGLRLTGRQRVELTDGAELRFGDARLRFFLPDGLLGYVSVGVPAQASKR